MLDSWGEDMPVMSVLDKKGHEAAIDTLDVLATRWTDRPGWALSIVNKDPEKAHDVSICMPEADGDAVMYSIRGLGKDSYNDIDRNEVFIERNTIGRYRDGMTISIAPHSVNVLHAGVTELI